MLVAITLFEFFDIDEGSVEIVTVNPQYIISSRESSFLYPQPRNRSISLWWPEKS
jgi:hypothetical protein